MMHYKTLLTLADYVLWHDIFVLNKLWTVILEQLSEILNELGILAVMIASVDEKLLSHLKRQDFLDVYLQGIRCPLKWLPYLQMIKSRLLYYIVEYLRGSVLELKLMGFQRLLIGVTGLFIRLSEKVTLIIQMIHR